MSKELQVGASEGGGLDGGGEERESIGRESVLKESVEDFLSLYLSPWGDVAVIYCGPSFPQGDGGEMDS